ncbi:MAG TPA: ARMT1-like domain-containing protein, partial [Opitutaceae bacterium]
GTVTVAVRGGPVLNDATRTDARAAGLEEFAEIIDSGAAVPGTALASCSRTFRRRFREADLVIAKGQGNFETLHQTAGPLFCLFRVKCEIVAAQTGHPIGSNLIWSGPGARTKPEQSQQNVL